MKVHHSNGLGSQPKDLAWLDEEFPNLMKTAFCMRMTGNPESQTQGYKELERSLRRKVSRLLM